jgi:hypothetical protein
MNLEWEISYTLKVVLQGAKQDILDPYIGNAQSGYSATYQLNC